MKNNLSNNHDILNKKYIFNPRYLIRNDISRIVLTTTYSHQFEASAIGDVSTFIHPMYAQMLSFFKGDKTLKENISEIACFFSISQEEAFSIIEKFIQNISTVAVEYDKNFFYFPQNILIENNKEIGKSNFNFNNFELKEELDLQTQRLNIPLSISFLINNKCTTDCIYCYADKNKIIDCTIPLSRIKELISEAKAIGVIDFDIRGGEIFMYEHWHELLQTIFNTGYSAYLSTKYPLDKNDVKQLLTLGVSEIQISLDSIYKEDLITNLRVGANYQGKILNTIKLLDEAGITIKIKSVITNQIYDLNKVRDLINHFKQYKNICIVELTVPAFSAFKTQEEFFAYRLSETQIQDLILLTKEMKEQCNFTLLLDGATKDVIDGEVLSFEKKRESFYRRAVCTGNQSSFMILPNGDVTLCEETYFNSNLILGNILNNSIMDVWTSKKAKELFFIQQSKFPKDSACSKCNEFTECRHKEGVCWADVISAYGSDKWLYPSPDCHFAPPTKNIIKTWQF